jgi:taurine dioxygenase
MRNSQLDIRRFAGSVGAEILNVDLSDPMDDGLTSEVRLALNQHGMIYFRDQHLNAEQYEAFGARFGKLTKSNVVKSLGDDLMVQELTKEPDQNDSIGNSWHTDQSFREFPIMGTMLLAREIPEYGGDTVFVSMGAAYDALSDGLKETLSGLKAVHSRQALYGAGGPADRAKNDASVVNTQAATEAMAHPMVIRHPETGRKILFINPAYTNCIEGWTEAESKPLLEYLFHHAETPEFACRFNWREGDLAFWDNRQVLHYAVNDYAGLRRSMYRLMVEGDMPLLA